MTNEEKIQAIRETADAIDGKVRDGYSGRGMYGRTCYGIVCDDSTDCIIAATKLGLPRPSVDGMGKGYIVYWPRITASVEAEA